MSAKQKIIYYFRYKRGGGRAARKLEKKGRRFLFLPYNKRKFYINKFSEKKKFWDYKKNTKLTKKQKPKIKLKPKISKKKNATKILKAKPNTFILFKKGNWSTMHLLINKCWIIACKLFCYYKATK